MLEMERLREALRQRQERLQEDRQTGTDKDRRPSPKDRLQEPSLSESAEKVREMLNSVPEVRRDRVEEIKRRLKEGRLEFDSKSVADRLLQESILDELL
jgi:flagellar biosynthesis anti-sigma factor FlgM